MYYVFVLLIYIMERVLFNNLLCGRSSTYKSTVKSPIVVSITTAIFFEIFLIKILMNIKFAIYKILVILFLFEYIHRMMEVKPHQPLLEVI